MLNLPTCRGPVNHFSGCCQAIWACRQYHCCCWYILGVFIILCYLNSYCLLVTLQGSSYRVVASKSLPAALTSMSDGTKLANTSQCCTSVFKANTGVLLPSHALPARQSPHSWRCCVCCVSPRDALPMTRLPPTVTRHQTVFSRMMDGGEMSPCTAASHGLLKRTRNQRLRLERICSSGVAHLAPSFHWLLCYTSRRPRAGVAPAITPL